jgi:hypothetical protein
VTWPISLKLEETQELRGLLRAHEAEDLTRIVLRGAERFVDRRKRRRMRYNGLSRVYSLSGVFG